MHKVQFYKQERKERERERGTFPSCFSTSSHQPVHKRKPQTIFSPSLVVSYQRKVTKRRVRERERKKEREQTNSMLLSFTFIITFFILCFSAWAVRSNPVLVLCPIGGDKSVFRGRACEFFLCDGDWCHKYLCTLLARGFNRTAG